jgi:hypothetical protein
MQKFVKINGTQYNVKLAKDSNFVNVNESDLDALKEVAEKMFGNENISNEKKYQRTPKNQSINSESDASGDSGEQNGNTE